MGLHDPKIRGIVEVMEDHRHRERSASLGDALQRLGAAREQRGPVGVLDPFEVVPAGDRLAAAEMPRAMHRRGLFRFSDRARAAVRSDD